MKILYGVQGTGNGHITRARAMAKALSDAKAQGTDIDVQFLVSGRPKVKLFDMEPFGDYWWREGLTFRSKKGRVVLTETVIKSRPMQLAQDIRELDVSSFDLVITDYEPITAWAGKLAGIKVIGLGHQYAFGQSIPQANATMIDKLVLQNFAPADLELGLHWHHFGAPILPPIAPVHPASNKRSGDFVLVYLPFESMTEITRLLKQFPTTRFVIYHPESEPKKIKNLEWRKPSRTSFPEALSACEGVICNAGFELASETLQLGKKILVKPMTKQVEQHSNALALETLGWGHSMTQLDAKAVAEWLESGSAVQVQYPDTAARVTDFILQGANTNDINNLVNTLWAETVLPEEFGQDSSIAA